MSIQKKAWPQVMVVVVIFLIVINLHTLLPESTKYSPPGYAPDGYNKAIAAQINGRVTKVYQTGLVIVWINGNYWPFYYDLHKLPADSAENYPYGFRVGDSIVKKANSDTFCLIRHGRQYQSTLPHE